jgi:hypothetical protein
MSKDSKSKSAVGEERTARRRRSVTTASLLVVSLLVTAVVAVSARSWLRPRTAANVAVAKTKAMDDPQQQLPGDVTLTTLNSTGFSPLEIAHDAGRFRIVVQNKSGETNLDLRLDGEQSSRWTERHELGEVQGWIAEVELSAGAYTITDSRHPAWVCHLTVQ